jgi:hypothetical protein
VATKSKRNLYLYLAIACFIGIIAIFIVDGYLGIYDTFYITANEYEREIAPDYWLHPKHKGYSYPYNVGAEWGGAAIRFRYELDNRRFSSYSSTIKVSVWKENEKILDLVSKDKLVKPFDKAMLEWALDSEELQSQGFSVGEYTMKLERKGIERKIIVSYYQREGLEVLPLQPSYERF